MAADYLINVNVGVIINGSKRTNVWVKSWWRFYKVVQLHKPC